MDSSAPTPHLGDSTGDFRRRIDTTAQAADQLRHEFTRWLDTTIGPEPERRGDIVLAVYEAVVNATEHAYVAPVAAGVIDVNAHAGPMGALDVTVTDTGTWRPGTSPGYRGRGLGLMTALSDASSVTPSPHGTVVVLQWRQIEDDRAGETIPAVESASHGGG